MDTLNVLEEDGVVVVRLARPPVNAVNRRMQTELRECFTELGAREDVRVVVLSAEGEKAFCAGIDLRERSAERTATATELVLDKGKAWRDTQHALRHCPVPVIAAVDGPAIGAGLGLVESTDVIFASTRASFGLTEINVGLLGGSSKARRMVGPYKARMMFFTGDLVPAAEFHRLGAVEELVEPGTAEAKATQFARKLAAKSPIALRLAKESVLRIENMSVEDAYRTEQDYTERLRPYNDSAEAMRAFIEKRPPVWTLS